MIYRPVENEGRTTIKSFFAGLAIYITFFALVMLASLFCTSAFANAYYFSNVSGRSMQPTINPGVVVQEDKQDAVFIKVTKDVAYNDIITIDMPIPRDPDLVLIKRVIALDGDALTIILDTDGYYHTYVCRAGSDQVERLDESYISQSDLEQWKTETYHNDRRPKTDTTAFKTGFKYEGLIYNNYLLKYADTVGTENPKVVIKQIDGKDALFYQCDDDEIFFMGDHRSISSDARDTGSHITTVTHDKVIGKVLAILPNGALDDYPGTLWWDKIKIVFQYFWGKTEEFFAW